jgi:hypothetical protein
MTVMLDEAALARLKELTEPTTVVDADGKVIGFYTPAAKPPVFPHPEDKCPYTPEEPTADAWLTQGWPS